MHTARAIWCLCVPSLALQDSCGVAWAAACDCSSCCHHHHHHITHQAIASAPSAPRPTGADRGGSTAPECLHALRTSQDLTRKAALHGDTIRHLPELPQISSDTKRNTLIDESAMDKMLHNFSAQPGRELISANISSL
ncbi:hypothetical protein COO60DRAFT_974006 [Scenedesmus sp. NREL 46B-D3]|nr:hypothetical protein COO60DRAFT_974006 [Scenedesmus sp. NREL 46B-D3]